MSSKDYTVKEIDIDLEKYGLVLKRRWPLALIICLLTSAAAVFYASSQEDTYRAEARLLIEGSNQVSEIVGLKGSDRELKALTGTNNPLDTQVEIFRSTPNAQQVIERLDIRNARGQLIDPEGLRNDLKVSPVPGTDILEIAYEHPNPKFAAGVVNTAIAVYLDSNVAESRDTATAAQTFIAQQLPSSEDRVKVVESALRQFKEANGIVNLEEESKNTVEVLTTLDSSVTGLKAQLADTNARVLDLQQQLQLNPQEALVVGLVSESPGVQEVLTQLQGVQSQLAVARTRYRETHPEIVNLRAQLNALTALLNQRITLAAGNNRSALPADDLQSGELEQDLIAQYLQLASQRAGLAQQLTQLASAFSAQQSRAQALPSLEAQERELSRQLTAAQGTYETLLDNLQQAQVIGNQNLPNARIVSPALVPTQPAGTSKTLYLVAGAVAGALLGIIAAFLADFLDRSVKTVREGQEFYGYPLLGVIPAWRKMAPKELEAPRLALIESHTVPLVEAYQGLQSNLKFSYFDNPLKSIVVTSAVAGEGKVGSRGKPGAHPLAARPQNADYRHRYAQPCAAAHLGTGRTARPQQLRRRTNFARPGRHSPRAPSTYHLGWLYSAESAGRSRIQANGEINQRLRASLRLRHHRHAANFRTGRYADRRPSSRWDAGGDANWPVRPEQYQSRQGSRQDNGEVVQEVVNLSDLIDDYQVQDGDVIVVPKTNTGSVLDFAQRLLGPLGFFFNVFK